MVENLSFSIFNKNKPQREFPLRFFLLVLSFVSILFSVQLKAEEIPVSTSNQITITSGVIVYSSATVEKSVVIQVEPIIVEGEVISENDKKPFAKEIKEKAISEQIKVEKQRENKFAHFSTFTNQFLHENSLTPVGLQSCKLAVVVPIGKSLYDKRFFYQTFYPIFCQEKKINSYYQLSYLQFGKYRNSSLRAPPTLYFI
ncbi:hypothetical protein [Frigoriflavimonas asaccharolytica]|uniref:Uncharacterized protein n=1 Tax=Frigoriflavimonas asaccharolytica TaxID=2735899 RepID=A0A8J8G7Z8_9FLAO|nr:hypothetical protein [Frigoriflavimonas asaccharolytica]NRS93163.1 hypothetical protein [Frigoriflavimonas asaccharolytica]